MKKKILKDIVKKQDLTYGVILQTIDPDITESIAMSGLDFIILDLEHTGKTIESVHACLMVGAAYDVPMLIRPAEKEQFLIEQALDAGCQGVLVPTVETVEDCKCIVRSSKFAPLGDRGYCPTAASARWMNDVNIWDAPTYSQAANRDNFVIALVESPLGIKNLPEMLKVEGIDAFMLGPADLGVRIGKELWEPEVQKIIVDAVDLINKSGKICITVANQDTIKDQYEKGTRVVVAPFTVNTLIQNAFSQEMNEIRNIVGRIKHT